MSVKKMSEVPLEEVPAGTKTSRQVLIGPEEGPNFAMRRFVIEAGGEMPMHTNSVEHEQLVLAGRAEVRIADKVFHVVKNDVVFIPAEVPHSYRTTGEEAFEFLCLVPNREDIVKLV